MLLLKLLFGFKTCKPKCIETLKSVIC